MSRQGTVASTFTYEGKRYYAYGKTKEEAHDNAVKKKALLENDVKQYKSSLTVSEWADDWLKSYKEGTVSSSWYHQMKAYVENQIEDAIGDKRLTDVRPMDIQKLMNQHSDKSDSHQKKLLLVLRQIFATAEENDLISKDPTKRIKVAQRRSKSATRVLTDEERALTLKVADENLSDGIFFLIMLYCGCRPQEVSRLKMSDYDAENQILHIRRARKKDGTTSTTKSESGVRDVPVPNYLAERLYFLNKDDDEYIVTALNGSPLTETSQRNLWHRFKRAMDIANGAEVYRNAIVESTLADDLHPYCYRHTYCTDLQDAGVPITVAKVLMGHSDIQMTANIYTHKTEISLEDAREKINKRCGTKCGTDQADGEKSAFSS